MYFNTLIIMNEEALGYGRQSKSPSGYCKVSMPNRVTCYVQEMKQLPKGQNYKLYLTSKEKRQAVEMGIFEVGLNGSKETRWTINPKDINNSSVSAKDIDGALILVTGSSAKVQTIPLVGFADEPYSYSGFLPSTKEKTPVTPKTPVKHVKAEVKPVKPIKQESRVKQDKQEEKKTCDDQCQEINLLRGKVEELSSKVAAIEGQLKGRFKNLQTAKSEKAKPEKVINDYIDGFLRKLEDNKGETQISNQANNKLMDELFEKRIPINPFEKEKDSIKWVRITNKDLQSLPSLSDEWRNQPMITRANDEFKHFILGRDKVRMQYYLGIPDIFDPKKESCLDIDKVESFNSCRDVVGKNGEAGYWLVRL